MSARDELAPADGVPPPPLHLDSDVVPVATVKSLASVWAWISRTLYGAPAPRPPSVEGFDPTAAAPATARSLRSRARVTAVSVHTLSDDPQDLRAIPVGLDDIVRANRTRGVLARPLASRVLLFAAPPATLHAPTARSVEIGGDAHLVVLGHIDRCEVTADGSPRSDGSGVAPRRSCLRSLTVLAEEAGLIVAGHVPAFQITTVRGWTCDERRGVCLQSSYIGREGGDALFQITVADAGVRWATIRIPALADAIPRPEARQSRGDVYLTLEDGSIRRVRRSAFTATPPAIAAAIQEMRALDVVFDAEDK